MNAAADLRVLVVCDDELATRRLTLLARPLGCQVSTALTAEHGQIIAVATEPSVVLISLALAGHAFLARELKARLRGSVRLVGIRRADDQPRIFGDVFDACLQLPATADTLRTALGLERHGPPT